MAVSLHIQDLVKHFGSTPVVDRIGLHILPGELFFLLGPSGCGKTTLLRCIAGFLEPEEGCIRIGQRDITRLPPHRRETAMVFQNYALWPHMTVWQNVAFGLEMRKLPRSEIGRRVGEALELVRLGAFSRQKPAQLSGGQQQRVALARALVIQPQCLLLDEPLSNLDANLRLEMRAEIRRVCKEAGLTAVYVTHDQKEALSVADRLAILQGGKLAQCGTPREVYLRPATAFVAGFIGETNLVDARVCARSGDSLTLRSELGEWVSTSAMGDFYPGEDVTLSLRPEVLRLGPPPRENPNRCGGWLHDTVYLGEVAQHQVRVGGCHGRLYKIFELNPRVLGGSEGTGASFWADPGDVVVLRSQHT